MKEKIKKINPIIAFALAALLLMFWAAFLRPASQSLKTGAKQNAALKSQLAEADSRLDRLKSDMQSKIQDKTLAQEEILAKISAASERCNLSIDRLKVGEITVKGGLKSLTAQLEVRGYLGGISDFFIEICPETSGNSIDGFSLRRSGNLPWLLRKTDEEIPLDWWADEQKKDKSESYDLGELADLIGSGEMRCFAEITFVGGE